MSLNKINITVVGATGYVGLDLIKILDILGIEEIIRRLSYNLHRS